MPIDRIIVEDKCPKCGKPIEYHLHGNEDDQFCPWCGATIHWQDSTPWIEDEVERV